MFEEKEYKTNDRPISHSPSRNSSRTQPATMLPPSTASTKPPTTAVDDGDLLMRRKVDPDCDVVVLDVGTHTIKAGWAGEDSPRCVVPAVVVEVMMGRRGSISTTEKRSRGGEGDDGTHGSHHRYTSAMGSAATAPHEVYVGAAAVAYLSSLDDSAPASSLHISRPLTRSLLSSPDALVRLLDHIFTSQLHISPKDHAILLSYSPLLPLPDRQHLAALLFTHFHCPALLPVNSASLALFSSGRTTGLLVDVGEGRTTVVPVYEGFVLSHAILTQRVGGEDCTAKLASMLRERGKRFGWSASEVVRDMKEKLCRVRSKASGSAGTNSSNNNKGAMQRFVATNSTSGSTKSSGHTSAASTPKAVNSSLSHSGSSGVGEEDENTYELPSGEMIVLDGECVYEAMEVLFTGEGQGEGGGAGATKADESVSWAVGVKADDELDGVSSNQLSLSSAAGSRLRSSANTYRHNSANSNAPTTAATASAAGLPLHLSSLSALTRDGEGLPALVVSSLAMLDAHLRSTLLHSIVLAGGVSMSAGMAERVRREVEERLGCEVGVVCDSQRMYGAWVGGSMFGSLSTFSSMKVTADAYKKDESIMNKRRDLVAGGGP